MDTSDRSESITLQPSAPPLAYALALRITPELQAELIQAKLNGDDATVTFGKGGYNNVIKVRGKEFKFKSVAEDSPCDAYYREEDTLIEAGGVKRKLQVQVRISLSRRREFLDSRILAVNHRRQLKSLERAKRAADVAEAAGKSAVKAMLLVLLEERPLTIQAIEKHLEKSTKSKSLHRKILEKMLKEMCHLKSPGKYHLKPEAQEEARAVIKELEPVPGRGKQPKNAMVDARTIPGTERAQSARGGHEPSASGKDNASLGGTKRRRVVMEEEDEEEEGEEKEAAKELMAEETAAAEEEEFFHPYERESVTSHVRLKGPIRDKKQYDEYSEEYQEKYPVYLRLYKELDDTRGTFVQLLERHRQAESRHEEDEAGKQIKTLNGKIRKRYERMNVVFLHLHEQLTNIKLQYLSASPNKDYNGLTYFLDFLGDFLAIIILDSQVI
eukprot:gene9001-10668_t